VVVPYFTVRDRDRKLLSVDFDGLPTEYPYTLMVPQSTTEQVLARRLAQLGVKVAREHVVQSLRQLGESVEVTVGLPDGSTELVEAKYVVGADGMHSTVRSSIGVEFAGSRYESSFVLADVRMRWPLRRDEVQLFFSPAGLLVVAALPGDRYRIVATEDQAPEHPDAANIQRLLDERGPITNPASVDEVVWSSRFRVHHRLASAYRVGRVFLAGDAAHVHSPAGGQGMNTGIQDGVALASLLADVVADGASPSTLDNYERLRRPVAAGVLAMTDRMTKAATTRSSFVRLIRNAALRVIGHVPAIRRTLAMNLSELTTRPQT
jgi:2-polyprenyl-6-methoxyphenol hydroxylase-like FAD-dependent oxidoreductase